MPSPSEFDNAAVAAAARQFAHLLDAETRLDGVERIEVTLSGRGSIDRLFALEAALIAQWPQGLRRPAHDLVCDTGELAPSDAQSALTLRALGLDGAVVLRRVYDIGLGAGQPFKHAAKAHG
jgi:hypothetical protein